MQEDWYGQIFSLSRKRENPPPCSLKFDNNIISFYEMLSGFVIILLYMIFSGELSVFHTNISITDLIYLIILGSVCTAYAFSATVKLMKKISAFFVVLAINLEPIYGILLAFFIFGESERMTTGFYLGALVILLSVFSYPILSKKYGKS